MYQSKLQEKSKVNNKTFLDSIKNSGVSFWIDSSGGPKEHCNLSFYNANPNYYFYGFLNKITIVKGNKTENLRKNCFNFIEQKLEEEKNNKDGIFVGYFAYDLFQREYQGEPRYPDFFFAYFENMHEMNPREPKTKGPKSFDISTLRHLKSNMTNNEYLDKVKYIKNQIKEGNVYQVNLTREYSLELENIDEIDLYKKLRNVSPNPYGCFFKTPFVTILSSSPEEFLYAGPQEPPNRIIRTRPVKGTFPKNIFDVDEKNKAENIMIVDIERNDLGKICEYGSVNAAKLLEIEPYQHLNHAVSTVEGKLRQDVSLREIFEATFPGGSITGAPKIAAMKIINDVEPAQRGAYAGSFGYIRTDGSMDFNILIRTIFITHKCHPERSEGSHNVMRSFVANAPQDDNLKIVTFNVGGGIVADSDPGEELEEIKLKARGILNTLGIKEL